MSKRSVEGLVLSMALSLGLAACSASSGTPNIIDASVEHAIDGPAADRTDTMTGSDVPDANTVDAHDSGVGGKADSGAGGSGMGGMGVGGIGIGGSGMGGTGMGGSGGAGMGGSGMGGNGVGGTTAGTGGGMPDAGPDAAGGNSGAVGGADGGPDAPDGETTPDAPPDTAVLCGTGCPANVEPQALVLWVSADVGVSCDQTITPPRLTGWKDRRPGSTVTLTPLTQKPGPRCDGQTLNGTPLPYFDRPTSDINSGVLPIDLTPLNGSNYTIFVVERRRTADAEFFLGTDTPSNVTQSCFDPATFDNPNAHLAYRLGYTSHLSASLLLFIGGSYALESADNGGGCADPSFVAPSFSTPQASLAVELLSANSKHTLTVGGVTHQGDDLAPMGSLMQGYLGRASQLPSTADSRYLGEIAEVVIYKMALGSSEVTDVSNYLSARWGL